MLQALASVWLDHDRPFFDGGNRSIQRAVEVVIGVPGRSILLRGLFSMLRLKPDTTYSDSDYLPQDYQLPATGYWPK